MSETTDSRSSTSTPDAGTDSSEKDGVLSLLHQLSHVSHIVFSVGLLGGGAGRRIRVILNVAEGWEGVRHCAEIFHPALSAL